ncbi:MAG: hypothetical protein ACI8PZ_001032 [Myxococcota bacterium]|jgi:hypothetical protein
MRAILLLLLVSACAPEAAVQATGSDALFIIPVDADPLTARDGDTDEADRIARRKRRRARRR